MNPDQPAPVNLVTPWSPAAHQRMIELEETVLRLRAENSELRTLNRALHLRLVEIQETLAAGLVPSEDSDDLA